MGEKEARRKLWVEMMSQSFDPREWYERDEEVVHEETIMWVYRKTDTGTWTVGFYGPDKVWYPDQDYGSREEAVTRVNYLNGGKLESAAIATAVVHEAAQKGFADRGHR